MTHTDIQKIANSRLIYDLQTAKDCVENTSVDNLTIGISGKGDLPFSLGSFLTVEQWDAIKQMLIEGIDKKINETKSTL